MVAERLHKVLANSGVASRRACEQLIAAGQVTVDGKVVTEMGFKVDPAKNKILFGGQRIKPTRPVPLILIKHRDRESAVVEVTVHEGMNREVRRVFARFGLKVKHLKRLRVGPLALGHLGTGATRVLSSQEVEALRAAVKLREDRHAQG